MTEPLNSPAPRRGFRLGRVLRGKFPYIAAATFVAVATAVRLLTAHLSSPLHAAPLLLQLVAVTAAAAIGGLGPGLFAAGLAMLSGFVLLPPSASEVSTTTVSEMTRFVVESLLICSLGAYLYHMRRRAEASEQVARELEREMLEISEMERARIGHDLHDGLGQHLTGISLLSKSLMQRLTAESSAHAQQAERITTLVSESIGWTRELAKGLSPLALEADSFEESLTELCSKAGRIFGIECVLKWSGETPRFEPELAMNLYRITQEAISNSVKHGKARRVEIHVAIQPSEINLEILDDGIGLSAKTAQNPGIGLRIMQYRAKMIDGIMIFGPRSDTRGASVICRVGLSPKPGGA